MVAYLHHVPGRLRLKLPSLKGDSEIAAAVERDLAVIPGVTAAIANPVTGSLIIHYRHREIAAEDLWAALQALGLVAGGMSESAPERRHSADPVLAALAPRLVKVLATTALEWAVSRSAAQLVAAFL